LAEQSYVKNIFDDISHRYDLANSILSGFLDKVWRMHAVRLLAEPRYQSILDFCAGTLPLTFQLLKGRSKQVTALDLSASMLEVGRKKMDAALDGKVKGLVCGEGERLPFRDYSFDGAMAAFGVRNLEDLRAGLAELHRTLKPGGRLVILEFSRPEVPVFSQVYKTYLFHVLPRLAGFISGDRRGYHYLARSIYEFWDREELTAMLLDAGFSPVRLKSLTFGVVTIYCADKA
jgi:demethylmenaquinone methyltransferase / 2-methoxy-6-polyprenyl-1,4-benzoquinol methylase